MTYMKQQQQQCNNNSCNSLSPFPAILKFHELDHSKKRQYIVERLRFCDLAKRGKDYECLEEPERGFVLPVDFEFLEREYLVRQKEMEEEEEEKEEVVD